MCDIYAQEKLRRMGAGYTAPTSEGGGGGGGLPLFFDPAKYKIIQVSYSTVTAVHSTMYFNGIIFQPNSAKQFVTVR